MLAKCKANNDQRWFTDSQNYIITINYSVFNNHMYLFSVELCEKNG